MKKIALFIAYENFRDEEYLEPKRILEEANFKVDTISNFKGIARGKIKSLVSVDKTIEEVKKEDYDFLGLTGGSGALKYLDNDQVKKLFIDFYKSSKPIGAICISPVILAHSGLLKNKKATVWYEGRDELIKNGAIYTAKDVELDSNIITANGPNSAKEYAKEIIKILS